MYIWAGKWGEFKSKPLNRGEGFLTLFDAASSVSYVAKIATIFFKKKKNVF